MKMYIWKKKQRHTLHKEGQTVHYDIEELYANSTINFISEITCQS